MQRENNSAKQLHKNHCMIEENLRLKHIIFIVVFIAISKLFHLKPAFLNQNLILMHIIVSCHIIKFMEIYGVKLISKDFCNFFLEKACKLESKKFNFIRNLICEFVFIQNNNNWF